MIKPFAPGQAIELVEVWQGRVWEQRSTLIVEDSLDLIALWTPPGSDALVAVDADGRPLRLPLGDWNLVPARTFGSGALGLHVPGEQHSVIVIFDPPEGYSSWYINMESDLERTETGFRYEEHVLDILVAADMMSWRWKDEDELEDAVQAGMFTPRLAAEFRAEGERALEWLLARRRPYDRDWLAWKPPSKWG